MWERCEHVLDTRSYKFKTGRKEEIDAMKRHTVDEGSGRM